jgi:hypothetical protein
MGEKKIINRILVFPVISNVSIEETEDELMRWVWDENNYHIGRGVFIEIPKKEESSLGTLSSSSIEVLSSGSVEKIRKGIKANDITIVICSTQAVLEDDSAILNLVRRIDNEDKQKTHFYIQSSSLDHPKGRNLLSMGDREAVDRLSRLGVRAQVIMKIKEAPWSFFSRIRDYIEQEQLLYPLELNSEGEGRVKSILIRGRESLSGEQAKRILFLSANTTETGLGYAENEFRELRDELLLGKVRHSFELQTPEIGSMLTGWMRAMACAPALVHFSGRGSSPNIYVKTGGNSEEPIEFSLDAFLRFLRSSKPMIEALILNTMFRSEDVQEISRLGIFVIAHVHAVSDESAIGFAKGFYLGLGEGQSLLEAINSGLVFIEAYGAKYKGAIEVWKDGAKLEL